MGKVFAHVASRNNDTTPPLRIPPSPRFCQKIRSIILSRENYSFLQRVQQPVCSITNGKAPFPSVWNLSWENLGHEMCLEGNWKENIEYFVVRSIKECIDFRMRLFNFVDFLDRVIHLKKFLLLFNVEIGRRDILWRWKDGGEFSTYPFYIIRVRSVGKLTLKVINLRIPSPCLWYAKKDM